jgi:hypothetical protein
MVVTARDEIAGALQLPDAEEFGAAARVYPTIRARVANQADALHRLGMGRYQQGRSPDALELIGKAVALRLGLAAFRADLVGTYRVLEPFHQAIGCCRSAPLWRDDPEARISFGLALQGLGRLGGRRAGSRRPRAATLRRALRGPDAPRRGSRIEERDSGRVRIAGVDL